MDTNRVYAYEGGAACNELATLQSESPFRWKVSLMSDVCGDGGAEVNCYSF